jgi:spore maturation protein CgeB
VDELLAILRELDVRRRRDGGAIDRPVRRAPAPRPARAPPGGHERGFFGSSLVSAYWNGAATYYRGCSRRSPTRACRITFFEPDAYERQAHRDIADPSWARVHVYAPTEAGVRAALRAGGERRPRRQGERRGRLRRAARAGVLDLQDKNRLVIFWDVRRARTLDRVRADRADPFRALIPRYDAVFTYGGGMPVISAYQELGATFCLPVYNGLDPDTHHPAHRDLRYACALVFLGNRLPDREARVDEFFFSWRDGGPTGSSAGR